MGFPSAISIAQRWVAERLGAGEPAIDATAGNGVDTLFLAKQSGARGTIYAFDIQAVALEQTQERISSENAGPLATVKLIHRSHDGMAEEVPSDHHGRIAAVMFNLGYLPGSDQVVITNPASTLPALQAALGLLRKNGVLTIVLYPGHPGGHEEAEAVEAWAAGLDPLTAETLLYRFLNRAKSTPYLLGIIKK
ncbi:tRNA (mnm(5)s(2)U34)-methyltransferase [Gorillibacterium massiliense]|uniref:tRNA (mnm(5)s(2)U34)-methyltransferase n=1 Tax=Gorillibacterium massiliense TaxID=1280390 RepID=UPI0004B11A88|nr:class I SAM-dependent methyltransferase [Gorillibacterium massiliense]